MPENAEGEIEGGGETPDHPLEDSTLYAQMDAAKEGDGTEAGAEEAGLDELVPGFEVPETDPKPAEEEADTTGDLGTEEKPAAKPAEEGDEKGDEEEGPDDKPPVVASFWDTDRQRKDQEQANVRKGLEQERDALKQEKAALEAQLEQAKRQPGETQTQETDAADKVIEDFQQKLASVELDEEGAGAEQLVASLKEDLPAALKAIRAAGAKTVARELSEEVAALRSRLDASEAEKKAAVEQEAGQKANAELNEHIAKLDEKHGAHIHNRVFEEVSRQLGERGYSEENKPDLFTVQLVYDKVYPEMAAKFPGKPKTGKAPKGRVPRADPGTGGAAPQQGSKTRAGSLESVAEQLYESGAFDPD